MSIITEALKKAEKERGKSITSKEYLNKILGPERKATYKREKKPGEPQAQTKTSSSETRNIGSSNARYVRSKTLVTMGILLLLAIISLTAANVFMISTPEIEVAASGGTKEAPAEAETYTDMKSELSVIENDPTFMSKMTKVFRGDVLQNEFLSNFILNGIIYDDEKSWAIVNDEVVRVGDMLDGAKVISIAPKRVTLLFKEEKFDLAVK